MIIKKLSKDFTPMSQGVFFSVETDDAQPTDFIVEIVDSSHDTVLATQQLHNTSYAKINVAPYLTFMNRYKPSTTVISSFVEVPAIRCKIRVGNTESDEVVISVNNNAITYTPAIVTSLPLSRQIARGERDEVLVLTAPSCNLLAMITSDKGDVTTLNHNTTTGVAAVVVMPGDFHADISTLMIELYANGTKFDTIHYTVNTPLKSSTRLVWISDNGSIERYSFPVSYKSERSVKRDVIATTDGYRAASGQASLTTSLISKFEPRATIEALSHIASSPKVWIERGRELQSVYVSSTTAQQNRFGEPDSIELDLCLWQKEVMR